MGDEDETPVEAPTVQENEPASEPESTEVDKPTGPEEAAPEA